MLLHPLRHHFSPLLKLAIPLVITGLLQSGVYFFETLFLSHLGEEILAAGALVSWLFGTFAVILLGIVSAINILVAHKFGAQDHEGISYVVRDAIWLAVILSIPSMLLFWNMSPIFLKLGQNPAIVHLAQTYLHALSWGILPNLLVLTLFEIMVGVSEAHVILKFTLLTVLLDISCSFVLIFGKFGFPALGIAGAGWGTSISYFISITLLILYLFWNKSYHIYFKHLHLPT